MFLVLWTLSGVPGVLAAGVEASPALLDWEGRRRDEFRQDIRITNDTGRAFRMWPTAADMDPDTGKLSIPDGPGAGHQRMSTWAEMPRSDVYLKPGETETVPVMFRVNIHAQDGTYYGAILFPAGESMEEAYARADSAVRVPVTIRVRTDIRERLNILRFVPRRPVFVLSPVALELRIENGGNVATVLSGDVHIMDRNGRRLGSFPVEGPEGGIPSGERYDMDITADVTRSPGRYKAFLEIPYGERALITDAVLYWIVPIWFILLLALIAVLGAVIATRFFHRKRHE